MGLLDKVKDAATKATEQAKHGVAVGKEKLEDTKLRKQIDEQYEAIGKLVVQQRRGEAPADAAAQIDAAVAKVAELEAAIEANNIASDEAESSESSEAAGGTSTPEEPATPSV